MFLGVFLFLSSIVVCLWFKQTFTLKNNNKNKTDVRDFNVYLGTDKPGKPCMSNMYKYRTNINMSVESINMKDTNFIPRRCCEL